MPDLLLAAGLAAALPHDGTLEFAPGDPAGDAGWQLAVTVEADRVISAEPRVGFAYRGDEQLFTARDYRQLLMLAGRHAWFTSLSAELGVAIAIESALGLALSDRAAWSRMLLAELDRLQAGLLLAGDVEAHRWRERVLELLEAGTGNRVHPMAMRIGGLGVELPAPWLADTAGLLDALPMALIRERVSERMAPLAEVGTLERDAAIEVGASGPVGWASGVTLDARVDAPYLRYAELPPMRIATGEGDIPARYAALLAAVTDAVRLATACLPRIEAVRDQPLEATLPKTIRAPEGTTVTAVETPLGRLSVLLASEGDKVPARLKLRTPSFGNVQAMARACTGAGVGDLPAIASSCFLSIGEIDR